MALNWKPKTHVKKKNNKKSHQSNNNFVIRKYKKLVAKRSRTGNNFPLLLINFMWVLYWGTDPR